MITCALTPKQLENLYKVTWINMKDQNKKFDPSIFMQEIFDKIKAKSDAENAAKFIQPIPDLILNLVGDNRIELKEQGLRLDLNELQDLAENFFDQKNGKRIERKWCRPPQAMQCGIITDRRTRRQTPCLGRYSQWKKNKL